MTEDTAALIGTVAFLGVTVVLLAVSMSAIPPEVELDPIQAAPPVLEPAESCRYVTRYRWSAESDSSAVLYVCPKEALP